MPYKWKLRLSAPHAELICSAFGLVFKLHRCFIALTSFCRFPPPPASRAAANSFAGETLTKIVVRFFGIMVAVKNRYMVMEVFIDPNRESQRVDPIVLSQSNVARAIKDSILLNFGECGLASSLGSFQVKYVNPVTKICIIRASREAHQRIWCSISLIRSIGNCGVLFNLLDLSGCIRVCRSKALKIDEAKFEHYKIVAADHLSNETIRLVNNCFEKIKILEH